MTVGHVVAQRFHPFSIHVGPDGRKYPIVTVSANSSSRKPPQERDTVNPNRVLPNVAVVGHRFQRGSASIHVAVGPSVPVVRAVNVAAGNVMVLVNSTVGQNAVAGKFPLAEKERFGGMVVSMVQM